MGLAVTVLARTRAATETRRAVNFMMIDVLNDLFKIVILQIRVPSPYL